MCVCVCVCVRVCVHFASVCDTVHFIAVLLVEGTAESACLHRHHVFSITETRKSGHQLRHCLQRY